MRNADFQLLEVSGRDSAAKALLYQVATEKNWPADSIIEGYDDCSVDWIVLDGEEVVGATKLIFGNPANFPIRKPAAWPSLNIIDQPVVEAALLGVKQDARGRGVFAALCAGIYWYMIENRYPYVEAILDRRNLRMHREWGMRFQILPEEEGGGEKLYWGEPGVFPARLYVGSLSSTDRKSMASLMMRNQPDAWEVFKSYAPDEAPQPLFSPGESHRNSSGRRTG